MPPALVTLILHPLPVAAAVFVDGVLRGQTTPHAPFPFPLCATGEVLLTLHPLSGDYLPLSRLLTFRHGTALPPSGGDVQLYGWPEGLCELCAVLPRLPDPPVPAYPRLVTRLPLPNGRIAALHLENGLCLTVEEGWRVLYGARLNDAAEGQLRLQNGLLLALAPKTEREDALLLALGQDCQEVLRLQGDAVFADEAGVEALRQLPTLLGHQRRDRALWQNGTLVRQPPVFGFFTAEPSVPTPPQTPRAFFDAVQNGFYQEARQYLTPALAAELSDGDLQAFFHGCTQVRTLPLPYTRQGSPSWTDTHSETASPLMPHAQQGVPSWTNTPPETASPPLPHAQQGVPSWTDAPAEAASPPLPHAQQGTQQVTLGLVRPAAPGLYAVTPCTFTLQNGLIDNAEEADAPGSPEVSPA